MNDEEKKTADALTKLRELLSEALLITRSENVINHIREAIRLLEEHPYEPKRASVLAPSGHYCIPDFPNYTIDRDGRVFGLYRKRFLNPWASSTGHLRVDIRNSENLQKKPYIHDLVAVTFLGPKPLGAIVRHLNDDPSDNRLQNLKYGNQSDNTADSIKNGRHKQKFSSEQIQHIRDLHATGLKGTDIRELYPCSSRTMTKILTGSMHPSHRSK